jgi:hypothetical protein
MLCAMAVLDASASFAGPPYVTDDPVPTDYRNWEIYAGYLYQNAGPGTINPGAPFAEFNYGAMPNVQVSASVSSALDEFGIKTRFVQESNGSPQISFYPSVQVETTPGAHAVTLLPIWMQKSSGRWTAFGGGGVYLNTGPGERNYTFVGGALQRTLSPGTTIGAELYHQGADTLTDRGTTGANVGAMFAIGVQHAILFSIGRGFNGEDAFSAYGSYEFALGSGARR